MLVELMMQAYVIFAIIKWGPGKAWSVNIMTAIKFLKIGGIDFVNLEYNEVKT